MHMRNQKQFIVVLLALAALQGLAPRAQAGFWDFGWGDRRDRDHDRGGPGPGGHGGPYFTPHYEAPGHRFHSLPFECARLALGGLEFFYAEGMFYRMEAGEYVVVNAPVGAVVTTIPTGYQAVMMNGATYYSVNGVNYVQVANGYQVVAVPGAVNVATVVSPAVPVMVAPPASPQPMASPSDDTFTINIPNGHGTYTAVNLRRSGSGFVGPQGEFYTEFPRVDQLKAMYGR